MQIPQGVSVDVAGLLVKVKGPKGEVEKQFCTPKTSISVKGQEVEVSCPDLAFNNTVEAIIRCMFVGVTTGYSRKMKVIYAHFPFTLEVKGSVINVKNFLGEKLQRSAKIVGKTKIEIKSPEVTISGPDKEAVGQTIANIKSALRIRNKDSRVFQDGLYEIE